MKLSPLIFKQKFSLYIFITLCQVRLYWVFSGPARLGKLPQVKASQVQCSKQGLCIKKRKNILQIVGAWFPCSTGTLWESIKNVLFWSHSDYKFFLTSVKCQFLLWDNRGKTLKRLGYNLNYLNLHDKKINYLLLYSLQKLLTLITTPTPK